MLEIYAIFRAMRKRQIKKILETYLMDADEEFLIPPSAYRAEEKELEKFYSKAWRISNPEKAAEIDAAVEKALSEAESKN